MKIERDELMAQCNELWEQNKKLRSENKPETLDLARSPAAEEEVRVGRRDLGLLSSNSLNSLPDDKILDSSKLKEFADHNFKFNTNGRKLSKQVENIVGKGEIARYEQFLLFPLCFQKACFPGASKGVIVWEWVNSLPDNKILDWSKFEAFAENKINVTEKLKFVFRKVGFPAFSPFSKLFSKILFLRVR